MAGETDIDVRVVRAGLIGSGIQKSRTPAMHMREGERHGLDYRYDLIDLSVLGIGLEALGSLVDKAELEGFSGLNITHPCKQAVVEHVDELSDDVIALGASNTVVLKNGRRIAHNTDWWGFSKAFERGLPDVDVEEVVLLGAGGAGLAVAHALAGLGAATVHVFDLDAARVDHLVTQLQPHHLNCRFVAGRDLGETLRVSSGLAHATPTGMADHPGLPLDAGLLDKRHWVAEIVYFPLETELLRVAGSRGCRVLNGGGMAVYQAVGAFELFTGIAPDVERMVEHFSSLGEGGGI